jgi:hypothetical protein
VALIVAARDGESKVMPTAARNLEGYFPEDGHRAMVRFPEAIRFLAYMHTPEVVLLQQMIATVFKFVDSIEVKIAEWANPGFV